MAILPNLAASRLPTLAEAATIGNPQGQATQASELAALLGQFQQAQAGLERAEQLQGAQYIPNSGALGVLSSLASQYMGGRLRRKEGETAAELTQRILQAQQEAENQKLLDAENRKLAQERQLRAERRQAFGKPEEIFALTGELPPASKTTPMWTNQGLVNYDPNTGTYTRATEAGPQMPPGVSVDLDPNLPPEERAAALQAIQQDISGGPATFAGAGAGMADPTLAPYRAPSAPQMTARRLSPDEVAAAGYAPGTIVQERSDGTHNVVQTPPANDASGGKALPGNVVEKLSAQAEIASNTRSLLGSFNDDFAGNLAAGTAENVIGQLGGERFGLSTPGQADWWQQYDRQKNAVRNELFGSALTPGEQAAFERADIRPNMDPKRVRANLAQQAKIVEQGLARRAKVWTSQGYNADAVRAATQTEPEAAPSNVIRYDSQGNRL